MPSRVVSELRIAIVVRGEDLRFVAQQVADLGDGLMRVDGKRRQALCRGQATHGFFGAGRHDG
ncbi:hypothetical protein GCM10010220_68110 [Streptomyces parvulus]|uniref:Uncharacterized protein n=1 Tax=Streptomyces parvulus TaxID=146923 RepID=A0A191VB11_9ACTN|nr:hypothetical protein Spa2297_34070 [Streptomyces parvulus]GGS06302.1 hypothetical protein GCM10010220_68110 [Streptomyces parvulus]